MYQKHLLQRLCYGKNFLRQSWLDPKTLFSKVSAWSAVEIFQREKCNSTQKQTLNIPKLRPSKLAVNFNFWTSLYSFCTARQAQSKTATEIERWVQVKLWRESHVSSFLKDIPNPLEVCFSLSLSLLKDIYVESFELSYFFDKYLCYCFMLLNYCLCLIDGSCWFFYFW